MVGSAALPRGLVVASLFAVAFTSGCRFASDRADASSSGPASGIARAGWLVGRWHGKDSAGTFVETWSAPKDGVMLGRGELRKGGQLVFFEDLRLESRGEHLVYVASPGGRGATEFTSTRIGVDSVRFENPQHDAPQALDYRLLADGTLQVQIVGSSTETFLLRRD